MPILLATIVFQSTSVLADPDCKWKPIKITTTPVNIFKVQITQFQCENYTYSDEKITEAEALILDQFGNVVESKIGGLIDYGRWIRPDEITIVNTPDDFPYLVFLSSIYSSSNILHTYILYSTTPTLINKGEITKPVNHYQANNRKGSERNVIGFYKDRNGNYLIDRLTTRGAETGKCNACQKYNVETLMVSNAGLLPLNLRAYDIETYKLLE